MRQIILFISFSFLTSDDRIIISFSHFDRKRSEAATSMVALSFSPIASSFFYYSTSYMAIYTLFVHVHHKTIIYTIQMCIVSTGALSTSNYYPDSLESSFSKSKYSPLLMFCLVSKGQSKRKPHPHGQSFPVADLISGCFTSQPQSLAFIIGHSQYLAQSIRIHLKPFIRVLVRSGQFSKPCTSEAVFNKKV